jgi:ribonuclease-3
VTNLDKLEGILGVKFKNQEVLKEALTHRSYLNEHPAWPLPQNERLEYLGDAVLELAVTERLFTRFPDFQEGRMTTLRAALVNREMLSVIAKEIDLQKFVLMSRGEAKDSKKAKDIILSNAFEALVGAIYLDLGYEVAREIVDKFVIPHLEEIVENGLDRDPKSILQEVIQEKLKLTPTYEVIRESGPDHQKQFEVGVYFSEELFAEGQGFSKQEAENRAARNALVKLGNEAKQHD